MGRSDEPRGRRDLQDQVKGNFCRGNERERGYTRWGDRGAAGTRRETAALAAVPVRRVLLQEWSSRVGEASPARRTQKDKRRRRPRLSRSAKEPPPAVAILPLRGAEASVPFLSGSGLSRPNPGAVSVARSSRDRKFVSRGASGSRGRRAADVEATAGQRGVAGLGLGPRSRGPEGC